MELGAVAKPKSASSVRSSFSSVSIGDGQHLSVQTLNSKQHSRDVIPYPDGSLIYREEFQERRISCCYGFMVFIGLTLSLLALTLLVIYMGVLSQMTLHGKLRLFLYFKSY